MYVTGCWLLPLYDAFWDLSELPAIVSRPAEQERCRRAVSRVSHEGAHGSHEARLDGEPQALAETPHAEVQDEYAAVTTNRSGALDPFLYLVSRSGSSLFPPVGISGPLSPFA